VGGGFTGLSAAYELARAGARRIFGRVVPRPGSSFRQVKFDIWQMGFRSVDWRQCPNPFEV